MNSTVWLRWLRRLLVFGVLSALVTMHIRRVDGASVLQHLKTLGTLGVLVPLPYLLAMTLDSAGWRHVFKAFGRHAPLLTLLRVRIMGEAVLMSLSGGAIVADTLTPLWLKRLLIVPLSEGTVAFVARKCLVFLSNGMLLLFAAIYGFGMLSSPETQAELGFPGVHVLVLVFAFLLMAIPAWFFSRLINGSTLMQLYKELLRISFQPLQRMLARHADAIGAVDADFMRLGRSGIQPVAKAVFLYTLSWIAEVLETWIILQLLGAKVSFMHVLVIEPVLSLVRSLAFFVPAGLGVQDLGYIAFFKVIGVPEAASIGTAFVMIKRGKELLWIGLGYLLLLRVNVRDPNPTP